MVLRVRAPHVNRPFRTPFVWVTAPLGIFMCVFMIVVPAARHLDPAGGLDDHRVGDLFPLYRHGTPSRAPIR